MPTLLDHLLFISDQRQFTVVFVFHGEKGCEPKRDVQLMVELHITERNTNVVREIKIKSSTGPQAHTLEPGPWILTGRRPTRQVVSLCLETQCSWCSEILPAHPKGGQCPVLPPANLQVPTVMTWDLSLVTGSGGVGEACQSPHHGPGPSQCFWTASWPRSWLFSSSWKWRQL